MREGCRDWAEDEEESTLEPAAETAHLDQRAGEDDDDRLYQYVAVPQVRELVREHALQLGRSRDRQQARADGHGRSARPAPGAHRARMRVGKEIEARLRDASPRREPLHGGLEERRLRRGKLARSDHPERDAVKVPIDGRRAEQRAETEDRCEPVPAERPAEEAETDAGPREEEPGLEEVPGRRKRAAHRAMTRRARRPRARAAASPARARRSGS